MWFMYGGDSACVTHNVKWFLDTNYHYSWTVHDGLTLCPLWLPEITPASLGLVPYGGLSLLEKQQHAGWAVAFDWSSYNNNTTYTWHFSICLEILVLYAFTQRDNIFSDLCKCFATVKTLSFWNVINLMNKLSLRLQYWSHLIS
jgi:hypothetical protein